MSRRATGPDKLYRCCSGKKKKQKLFSDPGVNSWLWRQTPLFQSLHCFSWSHAFITVKVSLSAVVRGGTWGPSQGGTQDLVPPFRQWFFTLSGADWGCLLFKRGAERRVSATTGLALGHSGKSWLCLHGTVSSYLNEQSHSWCWTPISLFIPCLQQRLRWGGFRSWPRK